MTDEDASGKNWPRRFDRGPGTAVAIVVAGALAFGAVGAGEGARAVEPAVAPVPSDLSAVELPPALGEPAQPVYVAATGHTLGGVMLDYWRATGGAAGYGDPISEPFAAANGYYSQAFERGIFQYRPDVLFSVEPIVRLMPVGGAALDDRAGGFRADGKRAAGGGDRRTAAWTATAGGGVSWAAAETTRSGRGFAVAAEFAEWYRQHEGDFYLGAPLSKAVMERGRLAQWFEGGLLLDAGNGEVSLAPLPRELAGELGFETEPVAAQGLPEYDEDLFWVAANPNPVGDQSAPGPKRIEVSLTEQRVRVYQGETLVASGLVSTGLDPNVTETGRFRVRYKKPVEDMRGATDAEGNVVWVVGETDDAGEPALQPANTVPYGVSDVPNVMYINLEAEALHGAYWHDAFGTPMSHGCINLPLPMAEFLYGWAPLGTQVIVSE